MRFLLIEEKAKSLYTIDMNFIIVEDEKQSINDFFAICKKFSEKEGKQINVKAFQNPLNFLAAYDGNFDFDALFIDINMPELNGRQVCEKVREKNKDIIIVFVSAFLSYAIDGYKFNVFDFVAKPYNYQSLSRTFDRVIKKLEFESKHDVLIKIGTTHKRLKSKDIIYIESQGHNMIWHTNEGNIIGTGSISNLEEKLEKFHFARCSSSFIINLDKITTMKNNKIIFNNNEINITRSYKESFKKKLEDYLDKF